MAVQTTKDSINLLLVGKTGAGKSSTGNTIIQQRRFESAASQNVVTKECKAEHAHVLGRTVKVVDLPGLADAALDEAEDVEKVIEEVMTAVAETPDGYDAILTVITFGRLSREDQKIVAQLKAIFGNNFIAEFGILLITHGDQFDPEENDGQSFEDWCSSETGVLKELREECCGRVILFDNKSKNPEVKESQLKQLLSIVDEMRSGLRYLPKHFEDAQAERQKLFLASQEQRILDNIREPTRLIMNDLDGISVEEDPEIVIPSLQHLLRQSEELHHRVASQDNGTEVLNSALGVIKMIEQAVHDKLQLAESVQRKRELQNQFANMETENEEERQKLQRQLEEKDLEMQEINQKQKQEREGAEKKYEEFMEKQNKARREKIKKVLIASAIVIGIPALVAGAAAFIINPGLLPAAGLALRAAAPMIMRTVATGAATTVATKIGQAIKKRKEKK